MNPNEGFKKWMKALMLRDGKTAKQAHADFNAFSKTPTSADGITDASQIDATMNDEER